MSYTIYSRLSGQIEKIVSVPLGMLALQYDNTTHSYIEGSFDDTKYYIENDTAIAMPVKPSWYHAFDYTTKQWIDPRTPATEWPIVRDKRNQLLKESDWTQLPDVPLATKESWAAYRQALRDITLQADPFNIEWSVAPGN